MNLLPIFKNAKKLRYPLYSVFDSNIKQKTIDENIGPAAETAEKILKIIPINLPGRWRMRSEIL